MATQVSDLQLALDALIAKCEPYKQLFAYYEGDQPLTYTNRRLIEIFRELDARFTENWCSVVINATADRIILKGLNAASIEDQELLKGIWDALDIAIEADDAHQSALICGESFIIAWPSDETLESPIDDDAGVQIYAQDPWQCHVFYEPSNPRAMRFAAKWWSDENKRVHVTLYYRERIEYYVTRAKKVEGISVALTAQSFIPDPENPTAVNEYGVIPVFHFRTSRHMQSDLANVIPLQNGVNKLLADMMVAAEYGAYAQRYVISHSDTSGLKNAPGEVWDVPAAQGADMQPVQVGQFPATDLSNYLTATDSLAHAIGAITSTPKHYFFGQGGDPSGEALIAMESPLNKKAGDRILHFRPVWKQIGAFILLIRGRKVAQSSIMPVYDQPETVQPLTRANTRLSNTRAGIPIETELRTEGWSEQQLAILEEDKQAAQERALAGMQQAQQSTDAGKNSISTVNQ